MYVGVGRLCGYPRQKWRHLVTPETPPLFTVPLPSALVPLYLSVASLHSGTCRRNRTPRNTTKRLPYPPPSPRAPYSCWHRWRRDPQYRFGRIRWPGRSCWESPARFGSSCSCSASTSSARYSTAVVQHLCCEWLKFCP